MNYWLLTSEYPPSYGGGIGTYCYHNAQMMASQGHQVTVFVGEVSLDAPLKVSEENGVRVIRFLIGRTEASQVLGNEAKLSYDIAEVVAETIAREGRPDVLECQEYLGLPYFLLQRRWTLDPRLQNLPIVLTLHTPQFVCDPYNHNDRYRLPLYWLGEMERFSIKAADGLISPSRYLVDELIRLKELDGRDCAVVPNPFELPEGPLPLSADRSRNGEILYVGRLEPRKGIYQVLDYFDRLWQTGFDRPISLIGGDHFYYPRRDWMRAWVEKRYGGYIQNGLLKLEGSIPSAKLYQRLRQAEVCIMPSTFENFPYTVIEAMAHGAISLVSASGGHREIVQDGLSGFVFDHSLPDSFAERLTCALNLSDGERQAISEAAQNRIRDLCGYASVYPRKIEALEKVHASGSTTRLFPFIRGAQTVRAPAGRQEDHPGLLSVVIPFFNAGAFLGDALASISRSAYNSLEILVVDDGSDDPASLEVLSSLREKYAFQVVRKANGGLASARNAGAQQARGEFLAFLDADDTIEPEYFKRAVEIIQQYPNVAFAGCWSHYWGEAGGYWPAWNPELPYLLFHNTLVSGSLVYRRQDFLECGLNDTAFNLGMEDYESVIRMVENGRRGVAIPEGWFNYRVRSDSMMRQSTMLSSAYLYDLIIEKHRSLYKAWGDDVIGLVNANGPGYFFDNPTLYYPMVGLLAAGEQKTDLNDAVIASTPLPRFLYLWARRKSYPIYSRFGLSEKLWMHRVKRMVKSVLSIKD
ncbi:MAG TPA: glycosyltransferase [Anaerolineaceae bacterium]|nr:glycosyltransferase [Anaerolineaceae bacterium]